MNSSVPLFVWNRVVRASFTVFVTVICFAAAAQTNSWVSPTSGNWENSANWSLGEPPGSGQAVLVENHGWKAVSLSANTAQNFPQTMNIDSLDVISPGTDTVNSVLMNYAGLQTPLTVGDFVVISNNTSMTVLQSALRVLSANASSGIFDEGTMTEDVGSQVITPGLSVAGTYYFTNGTLTVTNAVFNSGYESVSGQFVQAGGSNYCGSLDMSGEFDLSGGQLVVPPPGAPGEDGILVFGNFVQSGGSVGDWLSVGMTGTAGGTYQLNGGFLHSFLLGLPTMAQVGTSQTGADSSLFIQNGGTNAADSMDVGDELFGNPVQGLGTYILTNGLLLSGSVTINGQGNFFQYGGVHSNASLTLSQSQLISLTAPFTNYFVPGHYFLHGGTFISGSVSGQPGAFFQTAGTSQIGSLQISGGQYGLMGGQLTVSNLNLSGGASFVQTEGKVTVTGTLTLSNANLTPWQGTQEFGELQLIGNTNSTLTLSSGASVVQFANSSGMAWTSGAMLTIENWNGSLSGGGPTQIFFGSDSTGLTAQQLSQIQFVNPMGSPSGTYSAQILSDGEVVPNEGAAAGVVNSWVTAGSGNWGDASSWSLGVLPNSSQSVMITNSGWKAVTIDSSTPLNFPDSMSVSNLTIHGATNAFNTLLMNFVGAGHPLVVGVDSNAPGRLVIGDTNSAMVMLSSGLIVNNVLGTNNSRLGEFAVDGSFSQSDNSEVVAGFLDLNGSGTYNLTNGQLFVGSQFIYGHFNQQGGTNLGTVFLTYDGEYDLVGGVLEGGVVLNGPFSGIFNQSGGTNMGSLSLGGPGIYQLSGGLLVPGDLQVGPSDLLPDSLGAGTVYQTGGTNNAGNIIMGVGNYYLEGGVLTASNLSIPTVSDRRGSFGSSFTQNAGYFSSGSINLNGVYDTGYGFGASTYVLSGGELETPTINLTMGLVDQTGGTNDVGVMTLDTVSSYILNGGLLIVSNFTDNGQTAFSLAGSIQQSGGTNEVLDTLFLQGYASYDFTNGLLAAANIELGGQATFVHAGGSFGGVDNIVLSGGSWVELTTGEQVGSLQLTGGATNSFLNLPAGPSVLRFADSSLVPWGVGGDLTIQNWSGSVNGGGSQQVIFGSSAAGLTVQQLSQVQFSNPMGLPAGTYFARILADGEVVPDSASSSSGLVNSWTNSASGNWDEATNWSLGVPPNASQSVMIGNAGSKTVSVNASTPTASMTVSNLFINGATNTENTLLLNNLGASPLTVLNTLLLQDGGQILDLNSGLIIGSGTFMVTNSSFIQDGGFVRSTNAPVYISASDYDITNGDFEAGMVSLGYPVASRFNQYGGTVTITNLSLASYVASTNRNGIALYGGMLNLPSGMRLYGEAGGASYFQSGGTNRTGQVTVEVDYGGSNPDFMLNGGLLADSGVLLYSGYKAALSMTQNGGSHVITNSLTIQGSSANGYSTDPATYYLNGGTLSVGTLELNADEGDSLFLQQSNSTVSAGTVYAHSVGYYSSHNTTITLADGTLSCLDFTNTDGGGSLNQTGGSLVVSNLLDFSGSRDVGITIYGHYTFTGGTLTASNINIGADWIIGDGITNRISNPGTFSLSHELQISNAVEQLGHFVLAGTNAIIDLAGSASRLSFANSSGETWTAGATLIITNWNGNPSGGGAEQLKFGTDQSGLTTGQLSQIQFGIGTNLYSAKILATGEIVPDHTVAASAAFSRQGNSLVLTWPAGWTLQSATNAFGPYNDVTNATPPYTNDMKLNPRQFFRLRQ